VTICECEECVAARKWIVEKTGVGGGPRPLSFLIASHDYMAAERKKYEVSLKKHIELVDRLTAALREILDHGGGEIGSVMDFIEDTARRGLGLDRK